MMKYKGMYLRLFSVILRKPMIQQYGRELTRKALKKVPVVYRQMAQLMLTICAREWIFGNSSSSLRTGLPDCRVQTRCAAQEPYAGGRRENV